MLNYLSNAPLVFILPILTYGVLHYSPFVWGTIPPSYGYFSVENVSAVMEYIARWGSIPKVLSAALLYTFGACWFLAPLAAPRAASFVRLSSIFLVPLFLSIPFVTDWDRILAYGFPVIIPLVCAIHWRTVPAGLFLFLLAVTMFVAMNFPPSNLKFVGEIALVVLGVGVGMVELYRGSFKHLFWLHNRV